MKGDKIYISSRIYSTKGRDEHARIFGEKEEKNAPEFKESSYPNISFPQVAIKEVEEFFSLD